MRTAARDTDGFLRSSLSVQQIQYFHEVRKWSSGCIIFLFLRCQQNTKYVTQINLKDIFTCFATFWHNIQAYPCRSFADMKHSHSPNFPYVLKKVTVSKDPILRPLLPSKLWCHITIYVNRNPNIFRAPT